MVRELLCDQRIRDVIRAILNLGRRDKQWHIVEIALHLVSGRVEWEKTDETPDLESPRITSNPSNPSNPSNQEP